MRSLKINYEKRKHFDRIGSGCRHRLWPKKKAPASAIVKPFYKGGYIGKWNEVARMPSLIETDLRDLTEEYSLDEDGTIKVITRAFNSVKTSLKKRSAPLSFGVQIPAGSSKLLISCQSFWIIISG